MWRNVTLLIVQLCCCLFAFPSSRPTLFKSYGAYLLDDRCLHAARLHLLLQEDLLLWLLDEVLCTVGTTDQLQDLT